MKLKVPIKGIFFDMGWTLLHPASGDCWASAAMGISPELKASIPKTKWENAFKKAMKYLDDNHLLFTEEEEYRQFQVFYGIVAAELPELGMTAADIDAAAYSKTYNMSNYMFFDDVLPTLDALKRQYKLGIISDNWPSMFSALRHGGIDGYFDCVTVSCFLGVCKPNPRMYEHALEQMGLPPEQTVFIDDGVENLDGAAKCGIQSILITAKPGAEDSGRFVSIQRLAALIDILP